MLESIMPLNRETLQLEVHLQLFDIILQGKLVPGKSVTVASIAKALEASLMRVREVIPRLMALGALTVVSRRSIGVPHLRETEVTDLRRVRLEVETTAVRWAVENVDGGCLERLSE